MGNARASPMTELVVHPRHGDSCARSRHRLGCLLVVIWKGNERREERASVSKHVLNFKTLLQDKLRHIELTHAKWHKQG